MNLESIEDKLGKGIIPVCKFVYFLPNHDFKWIKNLLTILKSRGLQNYNLLIVGYYYGALAKSLFPEKRVTVIDVDPLGILSNVFAVWLNLYKKLKFRELSKTLFLDFYKANFRYKTLRSKISKFRYEYSTELFKEFIKENLSSKNEKDLIEYLLRTIYRIEFCGDSFILNRAPKGFCTSIIKHPLKFEPDEVIIGDFTKMEESKKYDAIITSNLIDFVKDKNQFLRKIQSLLSKNGWAEISSYNNDTNKMLKRLCKNEKTFLGTGTFFKQYKYHIKYVWRSIYLSETTHIFKPNNL